eukprot:Nk52_evm1s2593 gene=Nk52_evmTU1s2593
MGQRVTFRRRTCYKTKSNINRIVKTPGGKLVFQLVKKSGTIPKCGDCGVELRGIPGLRPHEYANTSRPKKTVSRAYGGSRCAGCVRDRIVRAFLIEEQKLVKRIMQGKK